MAYLLLPGSGSEAEAAATALRHAGVAVQRTGRYLGDPIDGLIADWFVRFFKPESHCDLEAVVASAIQGVIACPAPPEAPSEIRVRLLQIELLQARARESALLDQRNDLRHAAGQANGAAEEVASLKAKLAAEQEAHSKLELDRTAFAPAPTAPPSLRAGRLRDEVEAVFTNLLPKLRLLRDSITVITVEYADRGPLYRALAELQSLTRRMPQGWKSVQSVPGWWERHVSDGRDNTGRLYACLDGGGAKWQVLISHKSDQPRDIAWLRKS